MTVVTSRAGFAMAAATEDRNHESWNRTRGIPHLGTREGLFR